MIKAMKCSPTSVVTGDEERLHDRFHRRGKAMKYCDQCGAENRDQAKVCTKCGTRFPDTLETEKPVVQDVRAELDGGATLIGIRPQMLLSGRYELIRELGHGAMGIVWLAKDRKLDIDVAVKVLPPELGQDPRAIARLKNEALAAMKLSHPNIVRLINFEEEGKVRYLTMEYVDGPNLLHVLADSPGGKLDLETFLKYAEQICAAVAYAHEEKIVHHDLKPANIMLTSSGRIKVTDFGIAHIVRETMTRLSKVETAGTLLYMAPELLRGGRGTPATDQYALGCTFYELLTGEPPFVRGDITFQHINEMPRAIEGVPEHVNEAIIRALAKESEKRWPTTTAFVAALRGVRATGRSPLPRKPQPAEKAPPAKEGITAGDVLLRFQDEESGKWGFKDRRTGKVAIKPQFDDALSFSEGFAAVKVGAKWGFIDTTGEVVIRPQFDDAWEFSEGFAAVQVGEKWGFIDTTGEVVIRPQFDSIWPFSEGFARVKVGEKWGFIDTTGKVVIRPQFDFAWRFSEGFAAVQVGEKWVTIDTTGKVVA